MRRRILNPLSSFPFLLVFAATLVTGWAQDPPKVLFIGGQDEPAQGADGAVHDMMVTWWGEANITYVQSGQSSADDAAGMDVVVLSSTPGSGDIRNKFHELEIGVLNWEEALGRQLSLGEMGITTGNRQKYNIDEITIEDNTHPITAELPKGTFKLLENPAETWGSQWGLTLDSTDPIADELLAPGAKILANVSKQSTEDAGFDFRNAAIVAVEQGDLLWQDAGDAVPAPGRRVMFPLTDSTANELTEEGWNLLRRSIEWTAGVLPEGGGDPSLIGWWPLTEGVGEIVGDSAGNADSFIVNADIGGLADDESVWVDAEGDNLPDFLKGSKVASFNGVNGTGAYIYLGDGDGDGEADGDEVLPLMTEDNEFTWAFWANSQQAPNNDIIFGNRYMADGTDFSPREFIKFTTSKFEWDTNNVQGFDFDDIPEGEWMHHAIVKTGLDLAYYRNGEFVDVGSGAGAPENIQPLFIAGQGVENWAGMIADVGIFTRALSENEILDISANGIASLVSDGPDVLLTFNEGEELPAGIELVGVGEIREEGGVDDSGYLKITDAANGEYGAVVFPDLLDGKAVKSFKFTADFRVGGGTDAPADGFSVNLVRPDDPLLADPPGAFESYSGSPNGAEASLPEEGSTTGLGIGFDEWDSGAPDIIGISVRVDGELVTQVAAPTANGDPDDAESLQTGPIGPDGPGDISELTWQPFVVCLEPDGKLTIQWKGQTVLDAFQTTFFPSPVRVVFGGRTGGANAAHHVDNIGLTIDGLDTLVVSKITATPEVLSFELTSTEESVLDKTTIALKVDGADVTPVVTDVEGGVTVAYTPDPAWQPGTTHTYELVAKDTNGNDAVRSGAGEINLRDGLLPYRTPLPGPEPVEGMWSVRYVFDAGTIGSLSAAVKALQDATAPDFAGQVVDVAQQFMDDGGGGGGIFSEAAVEYPDAVFDNGAWTGEDFVVFGRAFINITESGTYTFGVHTDDGYALRIFGAEFSAENGGGLLDPVSPDTIAFPGTTGNSDSRGTVELAAGTYEVEFIWYERGGGDGGELYAAKGDFATDGDTGTWALVGHPDGIQLGGATALPFQITNLAKAGNTAAITWDSKEGATYVIEKSTDLQDFQELTDGFESQGESTTYEDAASTEEEAYYRIRGEG